MWTRFSSSSNKLALKERFYLNFSPSVGLISPKSRSQIKSLSKRSKRDFIIVVCFLKSWSAVRCCCVLLNMLTGSMWTLDGLRCWEEIQNFFQNIWQYPLILLKLWYKTEVPSGLRKNPIEEFSQNSVIQCLDAPSYLDLSKGNSDKRNWFRARHCLFYVTMPKWPLRGVAIFDNGRKMIFTEDKSNL